MDYPVKAVILAAGKGTRLKTENCDIPKVMREANGVPLLGYVLKALSFIEKENIIIVAGYKKEEIIRSFCGYTIAVQAEQLGTGHAVMSAEAQLRGFDGSVLVCCGDMPLLTQDTYGALVRLHFSDNNDCTMLTGTSDEYLPYGRIIRDSNGQFIKMIEEKDCTEAERAIKELNSGVYMFKAEKLLPALSKLKNNNAQGEYYLTDVPAILRREGASVGICMRDLGSEIIGVNTLEQLRQVEGLLRRRCS